MATISVILKQNKANEQGELPLYIRIIHHRNTKFISLGIRILPQQWDEKNHRVKKSYPNSARVNALISKKLAEAEGIVVDMERKGGSVSANKLKDAVKGKKSISFMGYMEEYISDLLAKGQIGTLIKVKASYSKLKVYRKGKDLSFEDFDLQFLKNYDRYLRDELKNKINTIHSNLKIFRKLFYQAIREELIEPGMNPFTKFKLATEKGERAYLTEDELQAMENLELQEGTRTRIYRDMYILASYAGGIRISDVLLLKWANFDGSHINMVTQKTKEQLQIKLPSKALEILKSYASETPNPDSNNFIFPIIDPGTDLTNPVEKAQAISRKSALTNKGLKQISKMAGIEKDISFHTSRHTWATRALRKGMRIEYVSKLMAHQNIKTTQIYTKIVNSELDIAMDVFN